MQQQDRHSWTGRQVRVRPKTKINTLERTIPQLFAKPKHRRHTSKKNTALCLAQQARSSKSTLLVGLPVVRDRKINTEKWDCYYLHLILCCCKAIALHLRSLVPESIVFQVKSNLHITIFLPLWSITISRPCVFANDLILTAWSLVLRTLCQRTITKILVIVFFLLEQPYLHPRVHLDRSSAQWDAKWARLYCVIMVRCYPAEALRLSKQIDVGDAVILQREGNKHSNYQQWSTVLK